MQSHMLLLLLAAWSAVANPMDGMMGNMDVDAMRKMDGMDPLPPKQKPDRGPDGLADYPPMKKDIPYIKCSVCQKMAAKAYEVTGLGYLGADIVLDKEKGPLLLELNARPGLAIQIANRLGIRPLVNATLTANTDGLDAEGRVALAKKLFREYAPGLATA